MSAGEFTTSKYEADYGAFIHPIKVQEETLEFAIGAVTNAPPAGAVNHPIRVKVGKGNREIGLGPRLVTVEFTGTLPDGYTGDPVRIPVLTKALAAVCIEGAEGTYLGSPVRVVGSLKAEDVN